MEKKINDFNKKSYKKIAKLILTAILTMVIILGFFIGSYIHYRDMVIQSQKKNMLNLVTQVSSQLEQYFNRKDYYLKEILNNSEFKKQFLDLTEGRSENVPLIELLYQLQSKEYVSLEIIDNNGQLLKSYTSNLKYKYEAGKDIQTAIKNKKDVYYVDTEKYKSINIVHPINVNNEIYGFIRMKIDSDYIYNNYLKDYKLNEKGYISVKDKYARLLLHPSNIGIGEDVLKVRKNQHPDYDWSGLERILRRQKNKETGVDIYYSIWAGESERVKKISAFTPCNIGDTFVILNFTNGYNESISILSDITNSTVITAISLIVVSIIIIIYIYKVEIKKNNLKLESVYLNELNEKNALLMHQSKFAAMGEMLATIAHQLKQPLNALKISLYNIEDYKVLQEDDENYLNMLLKSNHKYIDKMAKTIDDFRVFFKPQNKKMEFNIYDAIEFAIDLNMARINNLEIDINTIGSKNLKGKGESNVFSQVILNLLNNSIDALQNIEQKRYVNIFIKEDKENIIIDLIDNGGGIKTEIIDDLFKPYVTTKGENGTGLGLYISKFILMEKFNGDLVIENTDYGVKAKVIIQNGGNYVQTT